MIAETSATGWYVYAVVDAEAAGLDGTIAGLRGFTGGSEIRLVRDGSLAAIVGSVSLDEFGERALQEHLNDRGWLEEKARAHEELLQSVTRAAAVVPLRFGAIYRELADVGAFLHGRRDQFRSALDRVRGRVELGVKGWVDRRRLEEVLAQDQGGPPMDAAGGRAYLERRQNERRFATEAANVVADAVQKVHGRLLELAVDGVVNRPQPRELTGRSEEMILNAAYLVPDDDQSLIGEVAALDAGLRPFAIALEVTGPWPAHNFVDTAGRP
jgi:hypothetical protein